MGGMEDLGRVGGGETIIKIYYKKSQFLIKKEVSA